MQLSDFDFHLPDSHIALRPAVPRDAARLLVVGDSIRDKHVYDLPDILQPGDLLVFNDTRVIPARLFGTRGDMKVEILLHKAIDEKTWEVYAKPAKRLKPGQEITFSGSLSAELMSKNPEAGTAIIEFSKAGNALREEIEVLGSMNLPPYIARHTDANDRHDYQTIFATHEGSVAAPTASLHYTQDLMQKLEARNIEWCTLTLHVGAGTFMPVRTEKIEEHIMHSERYSITSETAAIINNAKKSGRRIIPVGTTALRTLEAASNDDGIIVAGEDETDIFITPGYKFKMPDALLTNFHLPKSTLLMLVSAFGGMERMRNAYKHAIENGYRFYSYGDTSLLFPSK